jgi:threonine/homoserine/homoserine lactone efflux protein
VLGCLFVALAAVSDSLYAVLAAAVAGRLRRSERARRIRRLVSGTVFVALGATAATAKRAS